MDRKTALVLNIGKYGGYLAVFWVMVGNSGWALSNQLLVLVAVLATDNIRYFYLEQKAPALSRSSLFLQLFFIFLFVLLDGTAVGGILLVILVAESLLAYQKPTGDQIFLLAVGGFIAVSAIGFYWRSALTWNNMAVVLINCLFLLFAYAVSYMARRQLEERERAENALVELDRSRLDLEKAYLKLIEVSKEREKLAAAEERSNLARELHDTLAHTLTAIIVSLEAGRKMINRDRQAALAEIEKSQEQARRGLEEVRQTVKALRQEEQEKIDFYAALKSLARDYSSGGIEVIIDLEPELELPGHLEFPFYRIIQESITNSVRHGEASRILVRLKSSSENVSLEIEDNGRGCHHMVEGYGIRGMRERAESVDAKIDFICQVEAGFLVRLTTKE